MRIIRKTGNIDLARVFIAGNKEGKLVEFVESTQPPKTFNEKCVLVISTLFGCPVNCKICDAGGNYSGKLSTEEILFQIDQVIKNRFPSRVIDIEKFKVQFSRMGEPAFNKNVIEALKKIPLRYQIRNFIPSLSTVAPIGTENFFEELLIIKKKLYPYSFQLQFSIHSTDQYQRDRLIPVKKWDFEKISDYGKQFFDEKGKKITLNFALGTDSIVDVKVLEKYFDPEKFLVKITPINPTFNARKHRISSLINQKQNLHPRLTEELKDTGYKVILSIGEWEENKIGSNCGQYLNSVLDRCSKGEGSYTYKVDMV